MLKKHDPVTFQYSVAFSQIFPNTPIPGHISAPCCAQFAVPKTSILARTKTEYYVMRSWLLYTKLSNDVSGRIFEFAWHVVFGAKAFACEHAECKFSNSSSFRRVVFGGVGT